MRTGVPGTKSRPRVHFERKFAMSTTTAPTLFSSSVKNQGRGLVLAATIFFVLGVGGSAALYGNYVQTASAHAASASRA
jgi:hypothetical protein